MSSGNSGNVALILSTKAWSNSTGSKSGSGKSVFLRCLAGFYDDYEGVCEQSSDRKAFIFEEGGLLEGYTVFDNLRLCSMFSAPKSEKEIDDALQQFGVLDAKNVVAGNLTRVAKKMVQYARVDLLEPKILPQEVYLLSVL